MIFSNEGEEGSEDFPNFGGAVWTLWILVRAREERNVRSGVERSGEQWRPILAALRCFATRPPRRTANSATVFNVKNKTYYATHFTRRR